MIPLWIVFLLPNINKIPCKLVSVLHIVSAPSPTPIRRHILRLRLVGTPARRQLALLALSPDLMGHSGGENGVRERGFSGRQFVYGTHHSHAVVGRTVPAVTVELTLTFLKESGFSGLFGLLWDFLGFSKPLWAFWAFLGFSGLLWAFLGFSELLWAFWAFQACQTCQAQLRILFFRTEKPYLGLKLDIWSAFWLGTGL